jgi:hypothetical protein
VPQTLNNPFDFEQSLWRREMGLFLTVSKTRIYRAKNSRSSAGTTASDVHYVTLLPLPKSTPSFALIVSRLAR